MPQFNNIKFQPNRSLLKEVTANRLNEVLAEIKRNRPKGERGITVRHSGDGTYIGLAASDKTGGSVVEHPFRLFPSGENTFKVKPGTLNGIISSNWDQEFGVSDQLSYVVIDAQCAANKIVSTSLQINPSAPSEQAPLPWSVPSQFKALVGMARLIDGDMNLFQVAFTNLNYSVVKRITVNSGDPDLPYTNYYTWQPT